MTPLPATSEMLAIARRVVWFKEPEDTLKDPVHFLCHLMTYTLPEDLGIVLKHVSIADFRYALDSAKAKRELGWQASRELAVQLAETVRWYLAGAEWRKAVASEEHSRFQATHYDAAKENQR